MTIKLIASDMDGTLLDSRQNLPEGFFDLVQRLRKSGVRFAPASGRQYHNLYRKFGKISDDLIFISENGAMICDGKELVSFSSMRKSAVEAVLDVVEQIEGAYVVLAGKDGCLYEATDNTIFLENMSYYYEARFCVPSLRDALREHEICKVAVFCKDNAESKVLAPCQAIEDLSMQVVLSGADWVDCMNKETDKGYAMRYLQEKYNVSPDECMAFGDYLNDLEMLQAVTHSYAMENAHGDLKKVAAYSCPSNDENGVYRTICAKLGVDKQ